MYTVRYRVCWYYLYSILYYPLCECHFRNPLVTMLVHLQAPLPRYADQQYWLTLSNYKDAQDRLLWKDKILPCTHSSLSRAGTRKLYY